MVLLYKHMKDKTMSEVMKAYRIKQAKRARAIKAKFKNGTWLKVSKAMGVTIKTVFKWNATLRQEENNKLKKQSESQAMLD
jgi:hypothetical protein